jgi:hypothetical protein
MAIKGVVRELRNGGTVESLLLMYEARLDLKVANSQNEMGSASGIGAHQIAACNLRDVQSPQ